MLLISTSVMGVLSSLQTSLRSTLDSILVIREERHTWIVELVYRLVDDLPLVASIACAIGFLVVLAISAITLRTYKLWIWELRQGRKPFPPVLIGNGTFWASSYLGHQLSHFILGFIVCVFLVFGCYFFLRVFTDVDEFRTALTQSLVTVSIPFVINFMVQFV